MAEGVILARAALSTDAGFNALVLAEQYRIHQLCRRMLGCDDDADTATQDTFLKAYRALQERNVEVDDPARWLTRIAANTCLDKLRSRRWQFWRRRPRPEDEAAILDVAAAGAPDAEDKVFAGEIGRRLTLALGGLSERQRAVFVLRHYEDRSLEEIATALGLDVGTVKAHLSRALAKLRVELEELYLRNGRSKR